MFSTTTGIPPDVVDEEMVLPLIDSGRIELLKKVSAIKWGMAVKTTRYTDMGLEDPVAIIGFPSVGLVSSITANFIVGKLSMGAIAGLSSPSMPPYCIIHGGVAYPPVRFYGRKSTTKTGRDLIICLSEYAPKPEDCYEVVQGILSYLKYAGCRDIICLEGTARINDETNQVVCGVGPGADRMVKKSKFTPMEGGMVKGITGIMMYEAPTWDMGVTTLMVPANPNLPDPGSAAAFIPAIKSIVPGLRINEKPLMAEADEIRKRVESEQEAVERREEERASQLYG